MLRHLSFLNVKKQIADYLIYFITLLLAVILLYGFNSLIFSPEMAPIMEVEMSGVQPLIYFVSFLIVCIIGWLVNYMVKFMLKKRGRELGTYMLLGISNGQISRMLILENSFFGLFALIIGTPCGVLFSEIIRAITMKIFGQDYSIALRFSIPGFILTILYIILIFFIALLLNQRQLKRLNLKELIYIQSTTVSINVNASKVKLVLFFISFFCLGTGSYFLIKLPLGNAYDIFIGLISYTLFILLFFESLSSVICFRIERQKNWMYRKQHLILYRTFAAKIQSLKRTMQALGILFMLAICTLTLAVVFSKIADKRQEIIAFDIIILHQGSTDTISNYDTMLEEVASIEKSTSYNLYHNKQKTFSNIRTKENLKHQEDEYYFKESKYDTYLKFSDYQSLRRLLKLKPVQMKDSQYLIHCMEYLKPKMEKYGEAHPLSIGNENLELAGVHHEDFNQYTDYGNGYGFIIVLPDETVENLQVLYSLYTTQIKSYKQNKNLSAEIKKVNHLTTFFDGSNMMVSSDDSRLITKDDYVFGRKIEKETSDGIPMILPMALLGVIFCITGATILAVQILSDRGKNSQQNTLLNYLGEKESNRRTILRNQIILYFLSPVIPALLIGNLMAWIMIEKISGNAFAMPVIKAEQWLVGVIGIVDLAFLIIYFVYGLLVYKQMSEALTY